MKPFIPFLVLLLTLMGFGSVVALAQESDTPPLESQESTTVEQVVSLPATIEKIDVVSYKNSVSKAQGLDKLATQEEREKAIIFELQEIRKLLLTQINKK